MVVPAIQVLLPMASIGREHIQPFGYGSRNGCPVKWTGEKYPRGAAAFVRGQPAQGENRWRAFGKR